MNRSIEHELSLLEKEAENIENKVDKEYEVIDEIFYVGILLGLVLSLYASALHDLLSNKIPHYFTFISIALIITVFILGKLFVKVFINPMKKEAEQIEKRAKKYKSDLKKLEIKTKKFKNKI
jgi:uncharacterized protein YacL